MLRLLASQTTYVCSFQGKRIILQLNLYDWQVALLLLQWHSASTEHIQIPIYTEENAQNNMRGFRIKGGGTGARVVTFPDSFEEGEDSLATLGNIS